MTLKGIRRSSHHATTLHEEPGSCGLANNQSVKCFTIHAYLCSCLPNVMLDVSKTRRSPPNRLNPLATADALASVRQVRYSDRKDFDTGATSPGSRGLELVRLCFGMSAAA